MLAHSAGKLACWLMPDRRHSWPIIVAGHLNPVRSRQHRPTMLAAAQHDAGGG